MRSLVPRAEPDSLWRALSDAGRLSQRWLSDDHERVSLAALSSGSTLGSRLEELRGRSVLLLTRDQLPTAMALIELDGVARRIVLCPSDVSSAHLPVVMATAEIDAVIGDSAAGELGGEIFVPCGAGITPGAPDREPRTDTEWVLLTSGTTGIPKLVLHTLATLTGAMQVGTTLGHNAVWGTAYDMRRYGGLADLPARGASAAARVVLSSALEYDQGTSPPAPVRAASHTSPGPLRIGAARCERRRERRDGAARMCNCQARCRPERSSTICHQAYPEADIARTPPPRPRQGHHYDVSDGLAEFPTDYLGRCGGVEVHCHRRVAVCIRSERNSLGYLGDGVASPFDVDGFVDTGDIVELRDGRYHFVGRHGGVINIGGQKVHPEEIEAVINRHPGVQMSVVRARKSPITGAIVVADVVAASDQPATDALRHEILDACRGVLPRYKVPASIRFVSAIEVAASGKLSRGHG